MSFDQKTLNALVKRRHPRYKSNEAHWQFLNSTYEGGRTWFDENIFQYHKEGEEEFKKRLNRTYRFNHTREIVDLVSKYIFKMEITRSEDAPESVKRFWKRATRNGLNVDDLMRQISRKTSVFGRIWVVVDSTKVDMGNTSRSEEIASDDRVFAYTVEPYNLLDVSYDEDGKINWTLIAEYDRDDSDPFTSSGKVVPRFRLWTRTNWYLFSAEPTSGGSEELKITLEDEGDNPLGEVPVFPADNLICDDLYVAPALIADIAYQDRAVANYLSNLDAIIQDQTFSQLAMPAQNLMPGEDAYDKLLEMGTKRVFVYDGDGGAGPHYLTPDVKQAKLILDVVNKIINEIYHSVGVAGERTKQDNAQGIDNSSGVAKAYDFERVNALLASKADSLELVEKRMCRLVQMWSGDSVEDDDEGDKPLVLYPDNFDVRSLYDEFEIAARLSVIEAPDEMRRQQMLNVMEKLFPKLKEELKKKMQEELKDWPPKIEEMLGIGGIGGGSTAKPGEQKSIAEDANADERRSTALKTVNNN